MLQVTQKDHGKCHESVVSHAKGVWEGCEILQVMQKGHEKVAKMLQEMGGL
jgi:hypothetical protein